MPWKWGFLFQGPKGELSFMVGYVQWVVILLSILLFLKKAKEKVKERNLYLISIVSFFTLLLLTQSFSKPIWMNVPLLNGFQSSYRVLLLASFFVSIIAGILVKNITNKRFFIILCIITISTTILNWGNRKMLPFQTDSAILHEFPKNMSKVGLGTTIWVDSNKFNINQRTVPHIVVLNGNATIIETSRTSTKHEYLINVKSDIASIKENTLYFPNWTVKVNGNLYPFNFINSSSRGIITFNLNQGSYKLEVAFGDTNVRKFSSLVSLSSLIALFILILFLILKRQKQSKIILFWQ